VEYVIAVLSRLVGCNQLQACIYSFIYAFIADGAPPVMQILLIVEPVSCKQCGNVVIDYLSHKGHMLQQQIPSEVPTPRAEVMPKPVAFVKVSANYLGYFKDKHAF
jgi:hypothetical protein